MTQSMENDHHRCVDEIKQNTLNTHFILIIFSLAKLFFFSLKMAIIIFSEQFNQKQLFFFDKIFGQG